MRLFNQSRLIELKKGILSNDQKKVMDLLSLNNELAAVKNERGATLFHFAARYASPEMLDVIMEFCQQNIQDKKGNTPLHLALLHGRERVAYLFLKNGSNPEIENKDGFKPSSHEAFMRIKNADFQTLKDKEDNQLVSTLKRSHSVLNPPCHVDSKRLNPF